MGVGTDLGTSWGLEGLMHTQHQGSCSQVTVTALTRPMSLQRAAVEEKAQRYSLAARECMMLS